MTELRVKCIALGIEQVLQMNDTDPDVLAWISDYTRGKEVYLSPEALDKGYALWSNLVAAERNEYRFIKQLGHDVLCRHARWFENPADENDNRMIDDPNGSQIIIPSSSKDAILSQENASRPDLPRK